MKHTLLPATVSGSEVSSQDTVIDVIYNINS
jgi:hypothetical protein